MKRFLASSVIGWSMMTGIWAASDDKTVEDQLEKDGSWSLSLYFENDMFASTDQQYTNGTKISWVSPDVAEYVHTSFPYLTEYIDREVKFLSRGYDHKNLAFSIGQNMYTPEDIATTELLEDDRPYAAWLYIGTGFHAKSHRVQDTLEIQLGVIGPAALGKEIQDLVHELRGIPKANGWHNQLQNELGLNLVGERRVRLEPDNTGHGWETDAIASGGIVLGNVSTYVNLGIEGRVGYNLPQDFGTTHIRPGGETNIPFLDERNRFESYRGEQDYGVLFFASVEGRAIARDIFLDGNTFRSSHSVSKEPLVADFAAGIKFKIRSFKVSYSQVRRTKQFKMQPEAHTFGSLMVSFAY
ncbi:MAG: lipid A deacylase LpxR family protein [Verrucomicrobia bacterium]|nr:lipid A deacylase LpxR family protein [Verrucomicrobiota bacterium]